jgi:hypothetical protein
MAKYRVTMVEKVYYEIYVEADSKEEAEEIAENSLGEAEITDQYIADTCVEEETE